MSIDGSVVLIARPPVLPVPALISTDAKVLCACRIAAVVYTARRALTAREVVRYTPGYSGEQRKAALRRLLRKGVVIRNGCAFAVNDKLLDVDVAWREAEVCEARSDRLAFIEGESRGERRRRLRRERDRASKLTHGRKRMESKDMNKEQALEFAKDVAQQDTYLFSEGPDDRFECDEKGNVEHVDPKLGLPHQGPVYKGGFQSG